jgi:hypothetical protein
MKQCVEALNASSLQFLSHALNASSFHCFNFLLLLTFHRFIASRICLHCFNALTKKKILTHRSDVPLVISKKIFVISIFSVAKPKNIVVFAFTYVLGSFALFNGDFCMELYSVDNDEARLQFLSTVKRFIASSLQLFMSVKRFNADTFYRKKHRLMLRRHYFLKEIHRLRLHRRYFFK